MARVFQPSPDIDSEISLEVPVRLLKQVLVGHGVKLGGRVLVVGCGSGDLVAFLDGLAYDVNAIDDSYPSLESARRRFPQFDFQYSRIDDSLPATAGTFDLILVQDLSVYHGSLLDLRSRTATANLLSCVKPGGDLVFVNQAVPSHDGTAGHEASCWKRHLSCFPGHLETVSYPESWWQRAEWDWLLGRRDHRHFFTVSLQLHSQKLERDLWCDLARRGLKTGTGECCPARASQSDQPVRRAA